MKTWLTSLLRTRVAANPTALEIADALSTIVIAIEDALVPTIGQRAVTLLLKRSFLANARVYPWMARLNEGDHLRVDIETMAMLFSQQLSLDAADAGSAFLQTFYDLLVGLLGTSLSERLLRPVWANHSGS